MALIARIRRSPLVWRILLTPIVLGFAVLCYVWLTLPDVRELARTNPRDTAFMRMRRAEAAQEGRSARQVQRWIPYSRISPTLKRAVLVAEDDAFFEHEGVDFDQIRESIEVDLSQGRALRGASTITQQLAKNLYLSPSRDPLRKLREWIIARRMEAALSKARIFEIYLNVIEWGDGIWGADAAARAYFGTSPSSLSASQSALMAGAIVNPRVLNVKRPSRRLLNRQRIILSRMGGVTPPPQTAADIEVDDEPVQASAPPPEPPGEAPIPEAVPPGEADPVGEPPPPSN